MKPVFPAQRRAEEFQRWVESPSTPADGAPTSTELLRTVAALRAAAAEPPVARAEFVTDLRAQLMEAATTLLRPDTAAESAARTAPARRNPRERRMAAAIGGFAIVSASASMAVAAQSALPGDTLYPLKRAIESVETHVQRSDDGKGEVLLDHATGRLNEATKLTQGGSDERQIAQTLEEFTDQATAASNILLDDYRSNGRASSIAELSDFTQKSLNALEVLEAAVPDSVRTTVTAAADLLQKIQAEAATVCPSCADFGDDFSAATKDVLPTLLGDALEVDDVATTTTPPRKGTKQATPTDDQGATTPPPTTQGGGDKKTTKKNDPEPDKSDDPLVDKKTKKGLETTASDDVSDLLNGVGGVLTGVVDSLLGGGQK